MPTARVIEVVDVWEDGRLSLPTGFPGSSPDQLGLDCLEEGLDSGIVVAVAFAAQRGLEAVFTQDLRVVSH